MTPPPHHPSAAAEAIGLALVAIFLGALAALAASARRGIARLARRRRVRRAWLRDSGTEGQQQDGGAER